MNRINATKIAYSYINESDLPPQIEEDEYYCDDEEQEEEVNDLGNIQQF